VTLRGFGVSISWRHRPLHQASETRHCLATTEGESLRLGLYCRRCGVVGLLQGVRQPWK
jgi:hypothetical protein